MNWHKGFENFNLYDRISPCLQNFICLLSVLRLSRNLDNSIHLSFLLRSDDGRFSVMMLVFSFPWSNTMDIQSSNVLIKNHLAFFKNFETRHDLPACISWNVVFTFGIRHLSWYDRVCKMAKNLSVNIKFSEALC